MNKLFKVGDIVKFDYFQRFPRGIIGKIISVDVAYDVTYVILC